MRSAITFLFLIAVLGSASAHRAAAPQDHTYTSAKVEYVVEFPSPMWRLVDEPDELHQHAEFIYGDRNDGYLRIRKETMEEGSTVTEFARRDQDQKLRYLPGYVEGKEDRFVGRMSGVTISFEYTQAGKQMGGRTYYLQSEGRTVYVLRFTGMRDRLSRIRNQSDQIARTFKLK